MRIAILLIVSMTSAALHAAPAGVSFVPSSDRVDGHDFVEVTTSIDQPDAANPFTEALVEGQFSPVGGRPVSVEGFCDSADGRVFRIRFMPTQPGDYEYSVTYRQGDHKVFHTGADLPHKRAIVAV